MTDHAYADRPQRLKRLVDRLIKYWKHGASARQSEKELERLRQKVPRAYGIGK